MEKGEKQIPRYARDDKHQGISLRSVRATIVVPSAIMHTVEAPGFSPSERCHPERSARTEVPARFFCEPGGRRVEGPLYDFRCTGSNRGLSTRTAKFGRSLRVTEAGCAAPLAPESRSLLTHHRHHRINSRSYPGVQRSVGEYDRSGAQHQRKRGIRHSSDGVGQDEWRADDECGGERRRLKVLGMRSPQEEHHQGHRHAQPKTEAHHHGKAVVAFTRSRLQRGSQAPTRVYAASLSSAALLCVVVLCCPRNHTRRIE